MSVISLGVGGKEKAQKYHVNIIVIIIMDPQISGFYLGPGSSIYFSIMLFPLATKQDQVFIRDRL